jgi:hypothetical protein
MSFNGCHSEYKHTKKFRIHTNRASYSGGIAAVAVPRFVDLGSAARVAALNGVEGAMKSAITLVRAKAITQGLTISGSNPGNQAALIVDFDGQS